MSISFFRARRGDGSDADEDAAMSTPTASPISAGHVEAHQREHRPVHQSLTTLATGPRSHARIDDIEHVVRQHHVLERWSCSSNRPNATASSSRASSSPSSAPCPHRRRGTRRAGAPRPGAARQTAPTTRRPAAALPAPLVAHLALASSPSRRRHLLARTVTMDLQGTRSATTRERGGRRLRGW